MAQPVGPRENPLIEGPSEPQSNAPSSVPRKMGSHMPQQPSKSLVGRATISSASLPDSRQTYTRVRGLRPAALAAVVERGFNVVTIPEGKQQ